MSVSNGVYNNLRQKLDVLGYTQQLPLAGIPLVSALFEDLIKTTESLRDTKEELGILLEEKSCWELGNEPYKCDNSRLQAECNELHLKLIREKEEWELCSKDFTQQIQQLQRDKANLDEHCQKLEEQIKCLLAKQSKNPKTADSVPCSTMKQKIQTKKPFISTVRCGGKAPTPLPTQNIRCTKCSVDQKPFAGAGGDGKYNNLQSDIKILEQHVKDLSEQVEFHKRKIEARDREVRRLNDQLSGGRPPAALAKDCCYKDVEKMAEDVSLLQREKTDLLSKMQHYEDKMHEAMQRALDLETQNKNLFKELDELKEAALSVERQANKEIAEREEEITQLQKQLQRLQANRKVLVQSQSEKPGNSENKNDKSWEVENIKLQASSIHKLYVEECEKASTLRKESETQSKKINKLQHKILHLQKELNSKKLHEAVSVDEEKIRIKSERDFFQKEYLRLIGRTGSDKEIDFLQNQIKSKDEELRVLRTELCSRQDHFPAYNVGVSRGNTAAASLPDSARSKASSNSSDCVQAIVLRAERERDCVRAELERVRSERNSLREKHLSFTQLHAATSEQQQQELQLAKDRVRQLERQLHELHSVQVPGERQIRLLTQEIDELKCRLNESKEENSSLRTNLNTLKLLQEKMHKSLQDYQNKLLIADTRLDAAESRAKTLDTTRESACQETTSLRNEVVALKKTYVNLENEKDKILAQLDTKTERAYQLEFELKACKEKRNSLEQQVNELEEQLSKLRTKSRERDTALNETSAESQGLRQQLEALKVSRDQAIAENGRLSNDLAESRAEILVLKKKLLDSEMEIEQLKKQLCQYVQEVKKAEDLLMHKEKEREEMLDHYRSLSHDAVLLEGSNQNLEVEAAEYKRQCSELGSEIEELKKDLSSRNEAIQQLEDKISTLESQYKCVERQLEEATDSLRLLKVDLDARKELCNKLDMENEKLHVELDDVHKIKAKIESMNKTLSNELDKFTINKRVSSDTLVELLSKTRHDLQDQIRVDSKLNQELLRLKKTNEELLDELNKEKERRRQKEFLALEYQVQNEELRHNITDDRFRQARSREQSPHLTIGDSPSTNAMKTL